MLSQPTANTVKMSIKAKRRIAFSHARISG